MKNTISFNTKFGWISATEINNKIFEINFHKDVTTGKLSKNLRLLRNSFIDFFDSKNNRLEIPIEMNGSKIQKNVGDQNHLLTPKMFADE